MMQADPASAPPESPRSRIAVIIAIAAALRLIFLGARSFWADEIVSVKLATDNWGGFWYWLSIREANMALYYLLLREWVRFGDGEAWVRLFSALVGIATIPLIYSLVRRLFDERLAWISALLAATSATMVEFSQEARSYSLVILLCVLSYYLFVRFIQEGRPFHAVAYAFVSICALYAHFFAALVICAQMASLFWLPVKEIRWSRLIPAWFTIGLGALPLTFYVLKRDVGQLSWVQPTTMAEVYRLTIFFAGGSKGAAAVLSALTLIAIIPMIAGNRQLLWTRTEASWRFMLPFLWVALPVLLTILVSLRKPIFVHRYLLVALPGYLILIAIAVARLKKAATLHGALVLFIGLSAASIEQGYFRPVEDWRGAVDYVLSSSQRRDSVLIYIPYGANNFMFYAARRERMGIHNNVERIDGVRSLAQIEAIDSPRTWLLIYPSPHFAEKAPTFENALNNLYAAAERKQFKGIEVLLYSQLKQPPSRLPAESAPRR